MNKDQINLGGTYLAKVTDKVVPVRIDAINPYGGWDATNLVTNKKVRIKSARRLREPAPDPDAKQRAKVVAESQAADVAANAHAVKPTDVPDDVARTVQAITRGNLADGITVAMPAKRRGDTDQVKPRKISGLDAAYQILSHTGEPMRCGDMVEKMLATGLWKTDGKTPSATIYAAIIREISVKGRESRFKKTDRGLFTINAK